MTKHFFISTSLLLSINFWDIQIITGLFPIDIVLATTWLWSFSAFYFFNNKYKNSNINSWKYNQYTFLILASVMLSMLSAFVFWKQNPLITLVTQRGIYSFLIQIPALLYVQPHEKDIKKALEWVSIGTIIVWTISIFKPQIISINQELVTRNTSGDSTDIGYYVKGIYFVILYFYFLVNEYIKRFSWKKFLQASAILLFLILYQNRSLLIGAVAVYLFSFISFRSKYKILLLSFVAILLISGIFYTWDIWHSLITETQKEINNPDYNRWKSLHYYLYDYSPNWFCYLFGNGFPSGGKTAFGKLMWDNMKRGIYASDLGMLGMWTTYGVIPLIVIYSVLIRTLINKKFPLYLKFISFHILLVPTIFHFWSNPGIFFFVIIIYLYAYHNEINKLIYWHAIHYYRQLQE